jgi:hypothetical protein
MRENNCEYLYLQTALGEVSGEKMPERIAATGQAITARLQEIEHNRDHHEKRHRIENALKSSFRRVKQHDH